MGNVGKERGGVNIGGDDTRYDLVSGVFQSCGAAKL